MEPACPTTASSSAATSYDNTGALGANTWRHVAFIEQRGRWPPDGDEGVDRWLMSSDVCKHCTHAACLDVCPTGALFRTEFGTVVVQEDVCNGCGYCVPACPFGVIDRREDDGRAWKCTLCYDRLQRRPGAGLRQGVPDRVDPVRAARRAAGARRASGSTRLHADGDDRGPAVRREPRRRRGRRRRVLPAARRARGVRPAAGSGRDHPRPARDVALGGRRPALPARWAPWRSPAAAGEPAVDAVRAGAWCPRRSSGPTTAGR